MKAYEFTAEITAEGAILLPSELAPVLPAGQPLRLLILVPEDGEAQREEEWPKLTAEEFYAAVAGAGAEEEQAQ